MRSRATVFLCLAMVAAAPATAEDDAFAKYGIFAKTAPRAAACEPGKTTLPLELRRGDRVCLIGNTLFERAQLFGHVSAQLHAGFPDHELVIRNLAWSADEIDLAPRPENFADVEQHLAYFRADVILAQIARFLPNPNPLTLTSEQKVLVGEKVARMLRARVAYHHSGFWQPMDTLRDRQHLEELWAEARAPWKVW